MISSERLLQARKAKGMTQGELAGMVENTVKSQISEYERAKRPIPHDTFEKFAQVLNVSPMWLRGYDEVPTPTNLVPMSEFHKGSLVGDIACGVPLNQEESEEVLLPFGADLALYCRGDSMINIGIGDGDIVYIRRLDGFDELINGRIAAVGIGDDYEYTLKRWFYNETTRTLKLVPENDNYKTLTFRGEELADIHLLGVAVGYTSVL
jgi:repressor LexA